MPNGSEFKPKKMDRAIFEEEIRPELKTVAILETMRGY
jgi:hypothetical protein